uniref:Carboxypeptidase Q n=1 Tax=mine drainage metagenome TaxID=410659 RepID=E6Q024_9ZZZZ
MTLSPETQSSLIRLGGQMMLAGKAYEYDRELADEIGPRLTGSANYVRATDWAVAEFTRLGLSNVHKEGWKIPATWEPETLATARMILPHEQRLHLESEGWSPSTPDGGVRGSVLYLADLRAESLKAAAGQIKGAIVLVDNASFNTVISKGFGVLFDALDQVGKDGAKAIILGIGTTNDAPSMIGVTNFVGSIANVPVGNLGKEDTLLLKRLLERGAVEHSPVEVEFSFKNRIHKNVTVNNVVAEIPGTDASGDYVLIGGHLDSWHPGTGAQDNGTGAATVVAVAEAIKASGLKPKRTIRFVLFGGEEEGTIGSIRYAQQHAGELSKCVGVFVTDTGAQAPKGWYDFGRADESDALNAIKPLLDSLGAGGVTTDGEYTFETDESAFLIKGVPAFVLWTPVDKYIQIHHKPSDTFDKVNQRDLNLGAATVGVTAYAFADAGNTLKHYSAKEVEDQLKAVNAYTEYQDMVAHKVL